MSLIETNFLQIFRLALLNNNNNNSSTPNPSDETTPSSSSSSSFSALHLLLSVSYECRIVNLNPSVIIECCHLLKENLSKNINNINSSSSSSSRIQQNLFQSLVFVNRYLSKLAVRVALCQLSSSTLSSIESSLELMRKELISLSSMFYSKILINVDDDDTHKSV